MKVTCYQRDISLKKKNLLKYAYLLCCVNFLCKAKGFSYTYIYSFTYSFPLWFILRRLSTCLLCPWTFLNSKLLSFLLLVCLPTSFLPSLPPTVPPSSLPSFYLLLFSQLHSVFFFFVSQKGSREEKKREKRPTVFSCWSWFYKWKL